MTQTRTREQPREGAVFRVVRNERRALAPLSLLCLHNAQTIGKCASAVRVAALDV
jgi:hypothetical protein